MTCDFASIKDPLDEALRTRFICSINNEAVLKALFKVKDSDLINFRQGNNDCNGDRGRFQDCQGDGIWKHIRFRSQSSIFQEAGG